MGGPSVLAISDLHLEHQKNRDLLDRVKPDDPGDWLVLAGDVANTVERVEEALTILSERFIRVIWVPGNHELHSYSDRPLSAPRKYLSLVEVCRRLGVTTPEDEYPVWDGPGGPLLVVPLFLLYDYSFGVRIAQTPADALRLAYQAGVVCDDEFLLNPSPYKDRASWCIERVTQAESRLRAVGADLRTVLVNHFPLRIEATDVLANPEFAQWCGTRRTEDWHIRFNAAAVIYGHLHIPRTTWHAGTPFVEVSLGYPREWAWRDGEAGSPRRIVPRQ
jgi:3',5'-cyclic AMP phosphodiesterase CpdA